MEELINYSIYVRCELHPEKTKKMFRVSNVKINTFLLVYFLYLTDEVANKGKY